MVNLFDGNARSETSKRSKLVYFTINVRALLYMNHLGTKAHAGANFFNFDIYMEILDRQARCVDWEAH